MKHDIAGMLLAAAAALIAPSAAFAGPHEDRATVSALDTRYQDAVKRGDAETMGRILADEFIVVFGDGTPHTRQELLDAAQSGKIRYDQQDEDAGTQTVRVWGDTAVVTARLWLKGVNDGKPFER